MQLRNVEEFICVVCNKTFLRNEKPIYKGRKENIRRFGCKTCSKICSKELVRINNKNQNKKRRKK